MAKTLEERLADMEAVHQIANPKARYINACDGGWDRPSHNADLVAGMFTQDGWWEAEGMPRMAGREAIRAGFRPFHKDAPFVVHTVSNPLIEVHGNTATGEWHLTEVFTIATGEEQWARGIYSDTFVRQTNGWYFTSMSVKYAYNGPYKQGFASAILKSNGVV
jgi:uncharacterized protein (TIGR02246 family)